VGVHKAKDSPLHLVLLIKLQIQSAFGVEGFDKFFVGIWHGSVGQKSYTFFPKMKILAYCI